MIMPLVSVVIPTYNHARYITQAVESALKQTYQNVEILVVDDGSTDNTAEVIKPYLTQVHYIYKENGGTSSALNYGIEQAAGKYVCWLSADDMFEPEKTAKQVLLLESDPSLGFCYTSFMIIDALGNITHLIRSFYTANTHDMVLRLMDACFINGSTVMMRKSALEKTGGFDETLPTAHDYDMWFRLLRNGPCGFIDEQLLKYRWHGENMSLYGVNCDARVKAKAKELFPEWLGEDRL
ncbi:MULTISPECIES: glycosyltransferase [Desulfosporosinus]|uniref:Chondroitin synthase n=1 Tax=Desulfosporosinus acididurans TaxID=476652 RepID=A0A0J1FKH6_9FIRM|nr:MULTISPECIES: glycosyltransferase [Desulfosporosinus]KLU63989.1 chondroitin synthase [Desulfosporosinus acididurans]